MNDEQRWQKSLADAAKVRELLQEDSRANGADIIFSWLEEQMNLAKDDAFVGKDPLTSEQYSQRFADYRAYKNLYVMLKKGFADKAQVAAKKIEEADAIRAIRNQ